MAYADMTLLSPFANGRNRIIIFFKCLISNYSFYLESGLCFDESEKCSDFVREGKCTNAAKHQYANFCKRSCGLCGKSAMCVFTLNMKIGLGVP